MYPNIETERITFEVNDLKTKLDNALQSYCQNDFVNAHKFLASICYNINNLIAHTPSYEPLNTVKEFVESISFDDKVFNMAELHYSDEKIKSEITDIKKRLDDVLELFINKERTGAHLSLCTLCSTVCLLVARTPATSNTEEDNTSEEIVELDNNSVTTDNSTPLFE